MTKNKVLQSDIMRYRTNKFSSNFTLLAVAFGCLYFLVLYGQYTMAYETNYGVLYYDITLGLSVIYNLFFLLLGCLLSIQIKNYQKQASYLIFILAAIQIARIFWFPLDGITAKDASGDPAVSAYSFSFMVVWLALSAASLIAAGVVGIIRNKQYYDYKKQLETGEFNIDAYLKELDTKEEAEAQAKAEELAAQEAPVAEEPVAEDSAEPDAAKED